MDAVYAVVYAQNYIEYLRERRNSMHLHIFILLQRTAQFLLNVLLSTTGITHI